MLNIIQKRPLPREVPAHLFEEAFHELINYLKIDDEPEVTLLIDSDQAIKVLNKKYRGLDESTDILSFESGEVNPETGATHLGDLIISLDHAVWQSKKAGHPLHAELQLLIVHGLLHLAGYDHLIELEKARMWKAQHEILTALHCPLMIWPE